MTKKQTDWIVFGVAILIYVVAPMTLFALGLHQYDVPH